MICELRLVRLAILCLTLVVSRKVSRNRKIESYVMYIMNRKSTRLHVIYATHVIPLIYHRGLGLVRFAIWCLVALLWFAHFRLIAEVASHAVVRFVWLTLYQSHESQTSLWFVRAIHMIHWKSRSPWTTTIAILD